MPQTRANHILTQLSLFRMGIRLTTISEPAPGMWRLVRTEAEARSA